MEETHFFSSFLKQESKQKDGEFEDDDDVLSVFVSYNIIINAKQSTKTNPLN
jgi:hypothetical protein